MAPLLIGAAVALTVGAYAVGLRRLRAIAKKRALPPPDAPALSREELARYARHLSLREIGGAGQLRLKRARVLVIGAGGLGSGALPYLAAAGIGTIGIIDDDRVEAANLQRQIIHDEAMTGQRKVASAVARLKAQNPHVTLVSHPERLTAENAESLLKDYDLILDGTDNFATRYLVNETAVRLKKPLLAAALTQWEGQISLYDPAVGAPCYACIFPTAPAPELVPTCAQAGVLGPLPGIIGAMIAAEAVKEFAEAGMGLRGRLLLYDALLSDMRTITIRRRADCAVCGTGKAS